MSHGSTEKCEPNFTPLLDLVLQLVMFFMLCANFVMEQTSVEIKLPEAIAAKALEKTDEDVFFLNVNQDGKVLLTPDQREGNIDTLDNAEQVKQYMIRAASREKARTGKDTPQAILILRVDFRTYFEKTYAIMKACRLAGYEKVQLRVIRHSGVE
jgi:biopolymer transport protein ExbD